MVAGRTENHLRDGGGTAEAPKLVLGIINADGSHRRVVPLPIEALEPDWSPDGKRLAFTGRTDVFVPHPLYIANLDGTGLKRVTRPKKGVRDGGVRWSPDGRTLLFIREGEAKRPPYNRVYAVSSKGGKPKLVLAANATSVSWSPDGRQIAYDSGPGHLIHILDLATRRDRSLRLSPCTGQGVCVDVDWQRLPPRR